MRGAKYIALLSGTQKGEAMEQVCIIFPILPGKIEAARGFMQALESDRRADHANSNQRVGMNREVWFLSSGPSGDQLIGYAEMANFEQVISEVASSQDEFDIWYKRRLAEVTGIDMNDPSPDLEPLELLSSFVAGNSIGR